MHNAEGFFFAVWSGLIMHQGAVLFKGIRIGWGVCLYAHLPLTVQFTKTFLSTNKKKMTYDEALHLLSLALFPLYSLTWL